MPTEAEFAAAVLDVNRVLSRAVHAMEMGHDGLASRHLVTARTVLTNLLDEMDYGGR